jgi:hypothetical protein
MEESAISPSAGDDFGKPDSNSSGSVELGREDNASREGFYEEYRDEEEIDVEGKREKRVEGGFY